MGRTQESVPQNQGHVVKADRARRAKETVNKTIPDLFRSNPRARDGAAKSELIGDPPALKSAHCHQECLQTERKTHINVRIRYEDTLTAARHLYDGNARVCILNMGSLVRPGGGFLQGATSQEEFICMRTTLYPSLQEYFYRLPELGGIYTPDVLVFRDSSPNAMNMPKSQHFFVDVVTAGMLRSADAEGPDEDSSDSASLTYSQKDRDLVTLKMKSVLRLAQQKGCTKLVLGAWGCGAYGNPVAEIANTWRKVIAGSASSQRANKERWESIEEITFALTQKSMLSYFTRAFEGVLAQDGAPSISGSDTSSDSQQDDVTGMNSGSTLEDVGEEAEEEAA